MCVLAKTILSLINWKVRRSDNGGPTKGMAFGFARISQWIGFTWLDKILMHSCSGQGKEFFSFI